MARILFGALAAFNGEWRQPRDQFFNSNSRQGCQWFPVAFTISSFVSVSALYTLSAVAWSSSSFPKSVSDVSVDDVGLNVAKPVPFAAPSVNQFSCFKISSSKLFFSVLGVPRLVFSLFLKPVWCINNGFNSSYTCVSLWEPCLRTFNHNSSNGVIVKAAFLISSGALVPPIASTSIM